MTALIALAGLWLLSYFVMMVFAEHFGLLTQHARSITVEKGARTFSLILTILAGIVWWAFR